MAKNPEGRDPSSEEQKDAEHIIRADFSRRPGLKEPAEKPDADTPHVIGGADFSKKEVREYGGKGSKIGALIPEGVDVVEWADSVLKALTIKSFLSSLKGEISKRAYHDSFAAASMLPDEAIVRQILSSNEKDWKIKPAYFKALADEFEVRFRNPREVNK